MNKSSIFKVILLCGSRHWNKERRTKIKALLKAEQANKKLDLLLIHGDATGADREADEEARKLPAWTIIRYPANWKYYGYAAGPVRNAHILSEVVPDECWAFPSSLSKGTWDMCQRANTANILVHIYFDDGRHQVWYPQETIPFLPD